MATSHEVKLTQMKEHVQKLGSSAEKYGDATLERFLIDKSMDPNKAAKLFVAWQNWRSSFVPLGFIPESEVVEELNAKKVFLQGLSKSGHPLVILQANKHYPAKDQNQYKKFMVHMLDKAIASGIKGTEIGNEKIVVIMDMQKLAYKNVDTHGFIAGFQILQSYYPERLAKLYMLNMPWFFASVWKIISRVLEKSTSDKIVIISGEKGSKQLIDEVGKEALPEELDGMAKLVLLQDVQVPQLKC
ncbi:putative CRAL-TRIO lipid binding domain, CRAL/TRIO domain superfamily [Helianthus annuus]|nr:putative CRAL-TRIO lipid binding domain, CRAL/TRIO domain superfamily [Helianthus annuus]